MDVSCYVVFLWEFVENLGVKCFEGKIEWVNKYVDNGFIKSLLFDDGIEIMGDFFIDCIGFKGLLIE